MRKLKTTDDPRFKLFGASCLSCNRVNNRTYRQYFAPLFSMIVTYANALPVTSDPKVFSFLGRYTKVPGSVFSLLIRRFRASMVQQRRTLAARNTIRLVLVAFGLIITAGHSHAHLGWTLEQFEQRYGQPVAQEQIAGRIGYVFTGEDCLIAAFFRETQVARILYIHRGGSVFDWETAKALLAANAPDAIWEDAARNEADKSYRVNGTKDGEEKYYASLTDDGQMLAIWTKEDDEAGRTKLDTPPVSSLMSSSEKSTGQVPSTSHLPTGQGPSTDSESTSGANPPEAPPNSTPSSPEFPTPAPSPHTKTAADKVRSSNSRRDISHVVNFDAKARPKVTSHRSAGSPPRVATPAPTPTPLMMNAGTGLYNSDNTQPFKNPKKNPGP
jgi:hypothetical protein